MSELVHELVVTAGGEGLKLALVVGGVLIAAVCIIVISHSLGVLKGRRERAKELGEP